MPKPHNSTDWATHSSVIFCNHSNTKSKSSFVISLQQHRQTTIQWLNYFSESDTYLVVQQLNHQPLLQIKERFYLRERKERGGMVRSQIFALLNYTYFRARSWRFLRLLQWLCCHFNNFPESQEAAWWAINSEVHLKYNFVTLFLQTQSARNSSRKQEKFVATKCHQIERNFPEYDVWTSVNKVGSI